MTPITRSGKVSLIGEAPYTTLRKDAQSSGLTPCSLSIICIIAGISARRGDAELADQRAWTDTTLRIDTLMMTALAPWVDGSIAVLTISQA